VLPQLGPLSLPRASDAVPDVGTEEAARADIQDTVKLVATLFEHQAEDSYGSPCFPVAAVFLMFVNKLYFVSVKCCFFAIVSSKSLASQGLGKNCLRK
jgi:hypothetical protein